MNIERNCRTCSSIFTVYCSMFFTIVVFIARLTLITTQERFKLNNYVMVYTAVTLYDYQDALK